MSKDEDRREQLKEALSQKDAMRLLTDSPGWRIMAAWLAEQITARDAQLYGNPTCEGADYVRGEGGILRLVLRYPQMVIQASDTAIALIRQEQIDGTKKRERGSPASQRFGDEDTSGWTDEDDR